MQKVSNEIVVFLVIVTGLMLILVFFILAILFLYRKKQIAYLKEVDEIKSDYEKNLLKTQLEIQEQTFQAISRDIHDNINLSLTLAKLNLNTMDLEDKQQSSRQLNTSIECISTAISDLSDISRSMNSEIITEQGVISALRQEIEKLRKLDWFSIQFDVTGEPIYIDAQKELFIFRIVQEAFNNILKHAQAKNIGLYLHYDDAHIDISIVDDGIGFSRSRGQEKNPATLTSGLRNMQKRAELLEGVCCIESSPGNGTTIEIIIPF